MPTQEVPVFRRLAAAPLFAAVVIALAACGPTPGPSPSAPGPSPSTPAASTPTSSATSTAGPVDPLDAVTRVLLLNDVVSFGDEAGWGVDGFRYDSPHDEAIAKLTAVFGEEPVSEIHYHADGSISESHRWGGFRLDFETGAAVHQKMGVEVTAASVNGVGIETTHGVRIGTPMSEAAALADDTAMMLGLSSEVFEAHFDHSVDEYGSDHYVLAYANDDGTGNVRFMFAPIESSGY